nr:hypothetical protein GCM10020093_078760 [Planobispora longispora]
MRRALAAAGVRVRQAADGTLEAYGTEAARVGDLAAASGLAVHGIGMETASLEEAFMRLTGEGTAAPDSGDGADHRATGSDTGDGADHRATGSDTGDRADHRAAGPRSGERRAGRRG